SRVAHSLGEVVGLGLRNLANCPVEMNLMPDSTLRWRAFNEKKPYFLITAFSLVFVALAVGFLYQQLAAAKEANITDLEPKLQQLQGQYDNFQRAYKRMQSAKAQADQIRNLMQDRFYWADVLEELRGVMIRSEHDVQKQMSEKRAGTEAGIWIETMTVGSPTLNPNAAAPPATSAGGAAPDPNSTINLVCRSINLTSVDPSANSEIAYAVEKQLKSSTNYFNPTATQLTGEITSDESSGTFTFGVTVTLANPLKF
ncbi:MAG TPA: hypothetical protein VFV81_04155, partial [Verrucomicrobiae bacterium]|nr:hypothetical protein [Verrucomicrobiae bacterium]